MVWGCRRWSEGEKSGGPSTLEPSFKVKWDTTHNQSSGFWSPRSQTPQRARSYKGPPYELSAVGPRQPSNPTRTSGLPRVVSKLSRSHRSLYELRRLHPLTSHDISCA